MAEIDDEALMSDLQRALETDEGIDNLDKAEAIYYISAKLQGDVPEGHPSDHNGNVTRGRVKAWAETVAEREREEDS